MYPNTELFIDGGWSPASSGTTIPVINPANEKEIGVVACAGQADLERAVAAAESGFARWRKIPAFDRYKLLKRAAEILRSRTDEIARLLTCEQGKPIRESLVEVRGAADMIDWFAEEARRTYGRVIPSRDANVQQFVAREPIGPVVAFSPWNAPLNTAVRKIAGALAAGCSVILKAAEETPASSAALIQAFVDAGLVPGSVNLVFGVPETISEYLIAHPVIRKVTFTGSTPVGKKLAALAGQHMKRITLELGGHAPVVIFEDADVEAAARVLSLHKFRNCGQVCISPTRFLVHRKVYDRFMDAFLNTFEGLRLGAGVDPTTVLGPLANSRRLEAAQSLVDDAISCGSTLRAGGKRVAKPGYYFEPTVLTGVPSIARIMNEEPFCPVVPINKFNDFDEAVTEANRLSVGLAAYAYTSSLKIATQFAAYVEAGMVSVNHFGLGTPETPFGGVKDSGYGSEGGSEAIDAFLVSKFISQASI